MGSEFKAVSKGRMRGTDREFGMDVYTPLYLNWVTSKVLLGTQGTLLHVKWQPGWKRSWGGGAENGCMYMAESLRCPPEVITTLLISYTPIQNTKF